MNNKEKATIYDINRLCAYYNGQCVRCILEPHGGCAVGCRGKEGINLINDLVLQWCKENPPKTYKQDFLIKFPNAKLGDYYEPVACRKTIYGDCVKCKQRVDQSSAVIGLCRDCWDTPMED